jgi:hypothetical protein
VNPRARRAIAGCRNLSNFSSRKCDPFVHLAGGISGAGCIRGPRRGQLGAARGPQAAVATCDPAVAREQSRLERCADRRALGRAAAGERTAHAAGIRLAPTQGTSRDRRRPARPGLVPGRISAPGRVRRTRTGSSISRRRAAERWPRARHAMRPRRAGQRSRCGPDQRSRTSASNRSRVSTRSASRSDGSPSSRTGSRRTCSWAGTWRSSPNSRPWWPSIRSGSGCVRT